MLVPEGDSLFWKSCFEFCIRDKKSKHASQCQTSRAAPFVLLQKNSPLKALEQLNSQRRLKNWILERCLNNCPTFSATFQHRALICYQRIYSLSSRKDWIGCLDCDSFGTVRTPSDGDGRSWPIICKYFFFLNSKSYKQSSHTMVELRINFDLGWLTYLATGPFNLPSFGPAEAKNNRQWSIIN